MSTDSQAATTPTQDQEKSAQTMSRAAARRTVSGLDKGKEQEESDFFGGYGNNHIEIEDLVVGGRHYMSLPVPRSFDLSQPLLEQYDDLSHIVRKSRYLLNRCGEDFLWMLAGSDIGSGTDPERLDDRILNLKEDVIDRKFFATAGIRANINRCHEDVKMLRMTNQVTEGNKIDFGLSGGYEGVSLGFESASKKGASFKEGTIFGIRDRSYTWAETSLRIRERVLHKYLSESCENTALAAESLLTRMAGSNWSHQFDYPRLIETLANFIERFGTHLITKCSHGYREVTLSKKKITNKSDLESFKFGLKLSALSFAKLGVSYEANRETINEQVSSTEGTLTVGPPGAVEKAMHGDFQPSEWQKLCGKGNAGVISHDRRLALADILQRGKGFTEFPKVLRYLTYVRVNDLQFGWNQSLFALSYRLHFRDGCCNESGVCVIVEGNNGAYFSTFHECPAKDEPLIVGQVTGIDTATTKSFRLSNQHYIKLEEILNIVEVYERSIEFGIPPDEDAGAITDKKSFYCTVRKKTFVIGETGAKGKKKDEHELAGCEINLDLNRPNSSDPMKIFEARGDVLCDMENCRKKTKSTKLPKDARGVLGKSPQ